MIVGFICGIPEGGIQFFPPGAADSARAHCIIRSGQSFEGIMRSLGGMQFQARVSPQSICEELRAQILEGRLFPLLRGFEENEELIRLLDKHGFLGDWRCVARYAGKCADVESEQLRIAQDAHRRVCALSEQSSYLNKTVVILNDINHWLDADDPEIPSPMLFYSVARARPLYDEKNSPMSPAGTE